MWRSGASPAARHEPRLRDADSPARGLIGAVRPFATPAEARSVVAEVAGASGPFKDFTVLRKRSLFSTTTRFDRSTSAL